MERRPNEDDDRLPRARWRLGVIAVLLIAAGAGGYLYMRADQAPKTRPGRPFGAALVRAEHGSIVVLVDHVRGAGTRLTALDSATGHQLGTTIVDSGISCWSASVGRLWCEDDGRLRLLAVPAFNQLALADALVTSSGLGKPVLDQWHVDGADVIVKLADGRGARVDAATLAVREADPSDIHGRDSQASHCELVDQVDLGDNDHLTFGDGSPRPLVRHVPHPAGAEPASYTLPGTVSFLSPRFVRVADPLLYLVLHDVALDRPNDRQLSRVDADRKLLWTANLGGDCESANLLDSRLVITTRSPSHRVSAIDATTGALAWTFGF